MLVIILEELELEHCRYRNLSGEAWFLRDYIQYEMT